jgi:Domain of unknown function (DUF5122) beta-propeller
VISPAPSPPVSSGAPSRWIARPTPAGASTIDGSSALVLVCYLPDGRLDTTFGGDGLVLTRPDGSAPAQRRSPRGRRRRQPLGGAVVALIDSSTALASV